MPPDTEVRIANTVKCQSGPLASLTSDLKKMVLRKIRRVDLSRTDDIKIS